MNGCHNRTPFVAKRIVQDGRFDYSLTPVIVSIPNFSHGSACQYTKSPAGKKDPGCTGCKHQPKTVTVAD